MVSLVEGGFTLSPSDITAYTSCDFAFLRQIDALLGRCAKPPQHRSELVATAAKLGDAHEQKQLATYLERFGDAVMQVSVSGNSVNERELAQQQTLAALARGTQVVFQAAFYRAPAAVANSDLLFGFTGFADFLYRMPDGSYQVQDTKFTASAKVTALLQLAAYAEQLIVAGVAVHDTVALLHGNGTVSTHDLRDITPFLERQRSALIAAITARFHAEDAQGKRDKAQPIQLQDPRLNPCFRCAACEQEIAEQQDLMLIAGMRPRMRKQLLALGITTPQQLLECSEQIASGSLSVPAASTRTLLRLSRQAHGQLLSAGLPVPKFVVADRAALAAVPAARSGDLFFSLYSNTFYSASEGTLGICYAAALASSLAMPQPNFCAEAPVNTEAFLGADKPVSATAEPALGDTQVLWAHTREQEREMFAVVMQQIYAALQQNPDTRIFHYGRALRHTLSTLANRHRMYETVVASLLVSSNLVDLQQTTEAALIVGTNSYALPQIALVSSYAHATKLASAETLQVQHERYLTVCKSEKQIAQQQAQELLSDLEGSLRYEIAAISSVYAFLLRQKQVQQLPDVRPKAMVYAIRDTSEQLDSKARQTSEHSELARSFQQAAQRLTTAAKQSGCAEAATAKQTGTAQLASALELAAAAFDYHRRERVSHDEELYWRLNSPPESWDLGKEVFIVEQVQTGPWQAPKRINGAYSRQLRLRGRSAEHEPFKAGDTVRLIYPHSAPGGITAAASGKWYQTAEVNPQTGGHLHSAAAASMQQAAATVTLSVTEKASRSTELYNAVPIAVVAGPPINTSALQTSLGAWAKQLQASLGGLDTQPLQLDSVKNAGWELLKRAKPRLQNAERFSSDITPQVAAYAQQHGLDPQIAAIARAVSLLDHSVLPVQGPPGAGKTYVSARVIKHLVAQGWKIGVVSQSHQVVEKLLDAVVTAGVPKEQVLKTKYKKHTAQYYRSVQFTVCQNSYDADKQVSELLDAGNGVVIGGTAWTFSSEKRFPAATLDLLVVDEGGQFGMVSTLASLRAAKNLMLVGDPQQLPQVSQGMHPVPINESALGWLLGDSQTCAADQGFFLAHSWRMAPEVCRVVSALSYAGQLEPAQTSRAQVVGWLPSGLHWCEVAHSDNSSQSLEEAAKVVQLCKEALAQGAVAQQDDSQTPPRALTQDDIIVVTPYNAQVSLLSEKLRDAGLPQVRVGTVDKFQGQEALISILSLAASNTQDNPRGIEFLLNRNRLNVAISRAIWSALIVCSPQLASVMPQTAAELRCLAAFLRLREQAQLKS